MLHYNYLSIQMTSRIRGKQIKFRKLLSTDISVGETRGDSFRNIWRKKILIEWEGHSTHQCTWEPKRHIPEAILNDYKTGAPCLSASAIQHIKDQVLSALQQHLSRWTGGHFYLEIPLPANHQLFGTERKNFLFHKEDFGRFHFALEKWDEFIYT